MMTRQLWKTWRAVVAQLSLSAAQIAGLIKSRLLVQQWPSLGVRCAASARHVFHTRSWVLKAARYSSCAATTHLRDQNVPDLTTTAVDKDDLYFITLNYPVWTAPQCHEVRTP
jgi:hypothetical protein